MVKIISYSLWGNKDIYCIGAIRNAELAKTMYKDWECWFYIHQPTVPQNIIDTLQKMDNVKIIYEEGDLGVCKPMMWRFKAIDDESVECMISRDTDSRFLQREVLAVNEWLESDDIFHIMRDHPWHCVKILGGMFGIKRNNIIKSWEELINKLIQRGNRQYDQTFLANVIYPIIKENVMIHDEILKYEGDMCKKFPIPFDDEYHFIGEYIDENEKQDIKTVNMLKKYLRVI